MPFKRKPDSLTRRALAEAIGVSHQYISKLVGFGMPVHSVQAAKDWIQRRSEETGKGESPDEAGRSLSDWRKEKTRLECEILALRLARENDTTDYVSIREIEKFIRPLSRGWEPILSCRASMLSTR